MISFLRDIDNLIGAALSLVNTESLFLAVTIGIAFVLAIAGIYLVWV